MQATEPSVLPSPKKAKVALQQVSTNAEAAQIPASIRAAQKKSEQQDSDQAIEALQPLEPLTLEEMKTPLSLLVKKLTERATLPARGSAGAAGYDLASAYDCVVPARGKALVKTDLAIAIPAGTYARIAPRSGLALKHSIDVGAGVVDADYRGPVGVILFNLSDVQFEVKQGDRIAQLILERIVTPNVVEVEDLEESARGAGGFGSTGVSGVVIKQG